MNEVSVLTSQGWIWEDSDFPNFRSGGTVPVYRLCSLRTGKHHYTTSTSEYERLARQNWKKEGIALYATSEGDNFN